MINLNSYRGIKVITETVTNKHAALYVVILEIVYLTCYAFKIIFNCP